MAGSVLVRGDLWMVKRLLVVVIVPFLFRLLAGDRLSVSKR